MKVVQSHLPLWTVVKVLGIALRVIRASVGMQILTAFRVLGNSACVDVACLAKSVCVALRVHLL